MFAFQFGCLFVCFSVFFFLIDVIAYTVCSLCNFQLFARIKKGNSSNQNRRNCWVGKKVYYLSSHILCKNSSFLKIISRKLFD